MSFTADERILLDTSILIYLLRGHSDVTGKLRELLDKGKNIATSAI